MSNQEDVLYGTLSISGMPGPPGPPGGVATWNTRKGDVIPQTGDYTFEQVGAFPATEILTNSDILQLWEEA